MTDSISTDSNKRGKKAVKSGIWYTLSSVSVKAILIVTTPLFTRLMSTSDYGLATNFTTWFTLLNVICSLNLWYSIGRAKLDFPGKLDEFVGSMMVLSAIFSIVLEASTLLYFDKVRELFDMNDKMIIALYIYLLAYPAIQLAQAKYKYLYNYKGNIAISVYVTISTIVISLCLVYFMPNNAALGKSLGAVISTIMLSFVFWISNVRKRNIHVVWKYWKYGLFISVPLILNSISLNILAQSDRIFITKICGAEYTAIYSLSYNYALLISIVLNAVNEAWLPWFHDTLNEGHEEIIRDKVKPLVLFGCWFGVGCIAIAPEAILLLGGKKYLDGIWSVPPITLGIVCSYIFQHYEHVELHLKKTVYISIGTVVAAIGNVILNIVFIRQYGFIAAAYTTLVCYILLMVVHNIICNRLLKHKLYSDRFMYLSLIITILISVFFMYLYNYKWFIRWLLMILVSVIYIIANRNIIINVFKMVKSRK